jgi:hypothetical protein
MLAHSTSQARSSQPAGASQRARTLGRLRPDLHHDERVGVSAMRRARSASGMVPGSTVSTSSPQVIGMSVTVQAADMPVIAGTTRTGHVVAEPGVEVHEGAVEERVALAEHHDVLPRLRDGAQRAAASA